jgi:uncharacterized damage-inducible protein DinB
MNREAILSLVAYDDWANDLIVEALEALSEEELNRPLPGSFPSLRATWAHLVMAQWLWIERWLVAPPEALPEWVASAGLEQLNATLLDVRRRRREALEVLGDADLAERRTYSNLARNKTWNVTVGQMLAHVVNHSTYHRGQITTLLRQLGKSGVTSDFLVFADQVSSPNFR